MVHPVLLFVPLDDRPVTLDMVVELAQAAGVDVRVPDRALLGDRFRPGEVEEIWQWLEAEAGSAEATALIASVEMLCFGGLVASRKSDAEFEEIAPYLERLTALASQLPAYLSAVIPRTPVVATDEDAPYWAAYGDALRTAAASTQWPHQAPGIEAMEDALQAADIPEHVRAAVRHHRGRHLQLTAQLITAASRGIFRWLLIGQDDTSPGSLSELERAALQAQVAATASNVLLTSGADELSARLLACWLNDLSHRSLTVRVLYTFPWTSDAVPIYEARPLSTTVAEHVASTGCVPTEEDPDIVLWVHNFEERQHEAVDQGDERSVLDAVGPILRTVRSAVREERVVGLADVRFANGGDRELVGRLLGEPRCAGIVAYAGWNTSSNAIGSVLAQAVVAHHLRANTVPGSDRRYRPALFRRILDDWGYQSVVRPQLRSWIEQQGGAPSDLGEHEAEAERMALARLRDDVLPQLQRSFSYHPVTLQQITFPWHRLFEARIALDVVPAGRGRPGIVVVDYDPRWPQVYEEDHAAIVRALGPMVRGIEHVGSTSVPGLAAKPTIDIMLGVSADDLDRIIEPLVAIGYEYNPDWEISMPLRRYFRRIGPDDSHTHHLHAVPYAGEFWTRHLRFRDYLRTHPDKAREYGELKKQMAREQRGSIDYTFAKTQFIQSVEALAGVVRR